MNIKKLDKRFKLYKLGLATHMTDVDVVNFHVAEKAMNEAYGTGQHVDKWLKQVPNKREWFYNYYYKKVCKTKFVNTNTAVGWSSIRRETTYTQIMVFRIYFRREEQATYLALKQI